MQLHRSTCSQCAKVGSSIEHPKAAQRTFSNEPTFFTALKEENSHLPQPSWEAVLNEQGTVSLGILPQAQGRDLTENHLEM